LYSDEVWTGIEYHVAAHLIYEGLAAEGLELVEAVRARHDGVRRNPWDEVECGHHYARSMASWALLTALSGFQCDMGRGAISFAPALAASTETDTFRSFWSCGRGWGAYTQRRDGASGAWEPEVQVLGGDMAGVRVTACGREWVL
jgi:non-lysosomal glucosylceramidase